MIQFFNVKKSYNGVSVLSVPKWELVAGIHWLQGVNGSGKTTLLRLIAGLLPFEGDITLNGVSLRRDPVSYRRLVSWADAEPLYPGCLSGEDLLAFYREVRGVSVQETTKLTAGFGMKAYLDTRIGSWSSGMVKKLSLALAFTGQPSLIVLDEPLVTLDQDSVLRLYQLMLDYRQRGGSILFTSHQAPAPAELPLDRKFRIVDQELNEVFT